MDSAACGSSAKSRSRRVPHGGQKNQKELALSRARRSVYRTAFQELQGGQVWIRPEAIGVPIRYAAIEGQQPGIGSLPGCIHDPAAVAVILGVFIFQEGCVGSAGLLAELIGCGWGFLKPSS